jgi:heptosyltransferase-3
MTLAARIRPLVILGPAEASIEPVFTAHGLPTIAQLELAEVGALARLARGFVGNDSGVSHLAAAAGAPGLAIFGPTDPARWRPLGRTRVIRREPLSALAPEEVAATLLEIIG